MSLVRTISTINIKPTSVSATNIVPSTVSTKQYAAYTDPANTNAYGTFKYGTSNQYGAGPQYSVGQAMPTISTVEI